MREPQVADIMRTRSGEHYIILKVLRYEPKEEVWMVSVMYLKSGRTITEFPVFHDDIGVA